MSSEVVCVCVFRLDKSSQNKFEAIVHKMKKNLNVFVPGSFFLRQEDHSGVLTEKRSAGLHLKFRGWGPHLWG